MGAHKFSVKADHIKLLKRMCVGWQDCEFGAPEIDPKRPYGNSDVLSDIAFIVGLRETDHEEDEFSDAEAEHLTKLHKEMETVLQIVLCCNGAKLGEYTSDEIGDTWKLVKK